MKKNFCKYYIKQSKAFILGVIYQTIYKINSRKKIRNKQIIFIENNSTKLSNNFSYLYKKILENYNFNISIHYLQINSPNRWRYFIRCIQLICDAATAKYIFLSDALNIFGYIPVRSESIFIQLWHCCGVFKHFGFSVSNDPKQYLNYNYNTLMTVSCPEVVWAYQEATGLSAERIVSSGISRTDLLYDKKFINNAYKHFLDFMPDAINKKIILYAPTFRGNTSCANTSEKLLIPTAFHELSESYVVVIKHHPLVKNRPIIPKIFQTFAKDFSEYMDIEELLCVADLCITDYSSLIFEYSLFEKPMIFFAYDYNEYNKSCGFFFDYMEMVPGPVCFTLEETIYHIKHVNDWFNKDVIIKFREKFMGSCDGHSTERILKMIFEENFEKN